MAEIGGKMKYYLVALIGIIPIAAEAQQVISGAHITSLRAHSGNTSAGDSQQCYVFQIGGSDTIGAGTGRYSISRSDPGYSDEKENLQIAFAGAAGGQVTLSFRDSGITDPNCNNIEYVTSVVIDRSLP